VSDEASEKRQYLRDVPGEKAARMCPDSWTDDLARLPTAASRCVVCVMAAGAIFPRVPDRCSFSHSVCSVRKGAREGSQSNDGARDRTA
jgi:hypothetical protein